MPTAITVRDETTAGQSLREFMLEFLTESITVRELIRARVFQEVKDYNASESDVYQGLVRPVDAEETLNGYKLKKLRKIDWEKQFEKAIEAFEATRVPVLVDGRQVESLDEEIVLSPETLVTFLKLVPLVGG